jgi:hypothetical protein
VPAWPTKVGRRTVERNRFGLGGGGGFRLFRFLRLISRPAYDAFGIGDEAPLSAEIMPVRVR